MTITKRTGRENPRPELKGGYICEDVNLSCQRIPTLAVNGVTQKM